MLFDETSVISTPIMWHMRQIGAFRAALIFSAAVVLATQSYSVAFAEDVGAKTAHVTFAFGNIARLKRDCEVRPESEAQFFSQATIKVQQLAQEFKVDFVIQEAVYASMRTDLTPYLLSALGCKAAVTLPNP